MFIVRINKLLYRQYLFYFKTNLVNITSSYLVNAWYTVIFFAARFLSKMIHYSLVTQNFLNLNVPNVVKQDIIYLLVILN